MIKKKIRLTESQFNDIIKESVHKVIQDVTDNNA
jgi:hypothetical protein